MLWLIFALLTLAILAILLYPLLKGGTSEAAPRVDYDIVVYRNQLAEIDQEIERGLLSEEQAEAARAEVYRRMLAAEDAELKMPFKLLHGDNRTARIAAVAVIAVVLPLGAGLLYAALGSPELAGKPYAWRQTHDPDFVVGSTADKLAAILQDNPSAGGYKRLAEMYFNARNYAQAAVADRRAIELGDNDAVTWSELGEAIVMTSDGAVVPEAMMAFTNSLAINPQGERSRFYIGLAEAQIGNLKQAVAIWRDLEKSSPPDAPWLTMLREHIDAFAKQGGFDPASVPPSPPSASALQAANNAMTKALHLAVPPGAPPAIPGNAAPPAPGNDRDTMITAMVQRLADRLKTTPNDEAGWVQLARSYNVMGKQDMARDAIAHALRLKPDDADAKMIQADIEKSAAAKTNPE